MSNPQYIMSCKYCGFSWKIKYFNQDLDYKCLKCGDPNLKVVETTDAFGYDSNKAKPDAYIRRSR